MTSQCQQCGEPAQTTICKTCAKHMRRQITSLSRKIPRPRRRLADVRGDVLSEQLFEQEAAS